MTTIINKTKIDLEVVIGYDEDKTTHSVEVKAGNRTLVADNNYDTFLIQPTK